MRPRTSKKEVAAMRHRSRQSLVCLIISVFVLSMVTMPAGAQQDRPKKPTSQDDEPITLNTTLVQVPVVVSERGGRYVSDLTRNEFMIFEDGVERNQDII